jgi:nitrate/TMAO reductase-like tetraheme cytochrome c subunit
MHYFRIWMFEEKRVIKHPQAPQGMELKCSDSGIIAECMRSAVAVLRQSNSHARPRTERSLRRGEKG